MAELIDGGEISWDEDGNAIDCDGTVIENITMCDYREDPDTVVDGLNDLLEEHGIEIVSYDTGGDSYAFAVQKKG